MQDDDVMISSKEDEEKALREAVRLGYMGEERRRTDRHDVGAGMRRVEGMKVWAHSQRQRRACLRTLTTYAFEVIIYGEVGRSVSRCLRAGVR